MAISSIGAADSIWSGQKMEIQPPDTLSKKIQDEISDAERQKQGLSSKSSLSAEEKEQRRKELQQEISRLDRELLQRESETDREQKKEAAAKERRTELLKESGDRQSRIKETESNAARLIGNDTDARSIKNYGLKENGAAESRTGVPGTAGNTLQNIDTKSSKTSNANAEEEKVKKTAGEEKSEEISEKEKAKETAKKAEDGFRMVMTEKSYIEQTKQQEKVIDRMEDGIVILKGEMNQDKIRGDDTDGKKNELKAQENRLRKASAFRLPDMEQTPKTTKERIQGTNRAQKTSP